MVIKRFRIPKGNYTVDDLLTMDDVHTVLHEANSRRGQITDIISVFHTEDGERHTVWACGRAVALWLLEQGKRDILEG